MSRSRTLVRGLAFLALGLGAACSGSRPGTLGPTPSGSLPPCPETPNCVHTEERPEDIPPFRLTEDALQADEATMWARVVAAVDSLPRTRVVEARQGDEAPSGAAYLHAESRSRIFRFVDDVEVAWRGGAPRLTVRSASRVGRSDLGVNRNRVARLRDRLVDAGVVAPAPGGGEDGGGPTP
jgi:uncharacterized protein (DUF1499 family)